MIKIISYFLISIYLQIILSSPLCIEGSNYCSRCNPITKLCVKCEKEIFVPDKSGGCENARQCILGKNSCVECTEEGNLCKVCEEGYFPDENGGCSYTYNCEVAYQGKCLKCKEGYILIGDNPYLTEPLIICKSLNSEDLKNCEQIDKIKGICQECKENYYLNSGDKRCISINNCYESTFGICDKCNNGFYLDKNDYKCKEQNGTFYHCKETIDSKSCNICDDSYYFDEEGKCVDTNYCSKSNSSICEKCISNYFLIENDHSCTKTEKNCFKGKKNLGICDRCIDNYYLDYKDEKCKSNQENNDFKYCYVADEQCVKCINNYYLGEDHKCSTAKNCAESDIGVCYLCKDNYFLGLDHKCNSVKNCIYTNKLSEIDECEECIDGYYYNKNNQKCLTSDGIFKNCKYGYDDLYCFRCKNDFYLNLTDNLCYLNNVTGDYYKCMITDYFGDFCKSCIDGYYIGYIDYKCTLDEGCDKSENENKCLICKYNYCLNLKTGKCDVNDRIISEEKKFYYRCNRTNEEGTACGNCLKGYTLKNGLCVDNNHCTEKNEEICEKCENDFCLNNIFGCIDAYSYHCLKCDDIMNFKSCDKCIDGYKLDENKNVLK